MKSLFEGRAKNPVRNSQGQIPEPFSLEKVMARAKELEKAKRDRSKIEGSGPQSAQELGKNEMTDL